MCTLNMHVCAHITSALKYSGQRLLWPVGLLFSGSLEYSGPAALLLPRHPVGQAEKAGEAGRGAIPAEELIQREYFPAGGFPCL